MFVFIYCIVVLVAGSVTFAVYGWDKRQARINGKRIPESTLHFLAFCGGWLGAIAGQSYFRHKTRKVLFQLLTWLIVVTHILLIFLAVFLNLV